MNTAKYVPGDKVAFTNDYGVTFHDKTIVKRDETSIEPRYFITPTDTPWFSFAEKNLSKAAA